MPNWKKDVEFHEKLKSCAYGAYPKNSKPDNMDCLYSKDNAKTGFSAVVYRDGNNVIISYRGSDALNDWINNNRKMGLKEFPKQIEDAKALLSEIESNPDLRNCDITLTGHSLGGSLAQMLGALYGYKTVTFNAYGTKDILDNYNLKYNDKNIVNYSNKQDPITMSNSKNQIGTVYEMELVDGVKGFPDSHKLENQKPILEQSMLVADDKKSWHDNADPYWNKGMDIMHRMIDTVTSADDAVKEKVNDVKDSVTESVQNIGREVGNTTYNHMTNEAQMYQNLAGNLGEVGHNVGNSVYNHMTNEAQMNQKFAGNLGEVGRNVGNSVYNHMTNEAQMNQNLVGNLGELGQKIGTNMKNAIGNLGSGIVSTPDKLKSSVSNLNSKVGNVPSNMKKGVNNVVSTATNTPNKVKNAFGNIAPTLTTAQTNMKNALGNFTSTANAASNNIKNNLDSVGESFKNAIKKVGDLAYKNQATNTSPETQTPNLSQNSTAFGASNLANPVQQKQGQNNKNGLAATNTAFPPVNQSLSSGQGLKNSGFSNNLMQNSLSSSPIAEDPIKKYNLENKNVDGFRLDNGGEIFVKKFSPMGGPPIGGSWQPWSGDFDPSKKLTDMDKDELDKALEFYWKFRR